MLEERLDTHGRRVRRSTQIVFAPGGGDLPPEFRFFKPELGIRGSQSEMVQRTAELVALGIEGFYGYVADEAALDEVAGILPELRATVS